MSAVGWLGLGKLGGPCADTLAGCGHDVIGYDPRPAADPGRVKLATLPEVVEATDGLVFVCVQTPHSPAFGGDRPVPGPARDFDYSALTQAVRDLAAEAAAQHKPLTAVIISTVLPGTTRARLLPLLRGTPVMLVYGPYFPAMGTEAEDFLNPEFQLLGGDNQTALAAAAHLYKTVHQAPLRMVSIESAELAKVAYNTFISAKIVYANMLAELCDATGADADEVSGTLALATRRILSPAYLRAGMGDGGACHPRDLLAMSWLSQRAGLSADVAGFLAAARESQSERLADLVRYQHELTGLPVCVLGKAFKPGVAMTDGSPALLLLRQLEDAGVAAVAWDPLIDGGVPPGGQWLFVVATAHPEILASRFAAGSVVVDPHGLMESQPGVVLVTPGRRR
jgi:UDPglucose 6-dehydrogenase